MDRLPPGYGKSTELPTSVSSSRSVGDAGKSRSRRCKPKSSITSECRHDGPVLGSIGWTTGWYRGPCMPEPPQRVGSARVV